MPENKLPIHDSEQELAAGYVLGDLSESELVQFEAMLAKNLTLAEEVRSLQNSLNVLPLGLQTISPPPALGDRIIATHAGSMAGSSHESPSPKHRRISGYLALAVGSCLLALLLGLDNLRLRQDLSLAQNSSPETVATLLQRPNSRLIALRSQSTDQAEGTLLFTPGKWQNVVVSLNHLPPLPPDQIYRMWLTLANGRILPCGEFKPTASGKVFITFSPLWTFPKGVKATGVFVTLDRASDPLEPRGTKILSGEI